MPETFLLITYMTIQVSIYIFQQPEEKKRKKETFELEPEPELDDFHPNISIKLELDPQGDRPVRACRTQQGNSDPVLWTDSVPTNQPVHVSHCISNV